MINKTKAALAAVLVLGSASTAFAVNVTANADRAPSSYVQAAPASDVYARAQVQEGRSVGVQREFPNNGIQYQYPTSDQKHWYERSPIDFNS